MDNPLASNLTSVADGSAQKPMMQTQSDRDQRALSGAAHLPLTGLYLQNSNDLHDANIERNPGPVIRIGALEGFRSLLMEFGLSPAPILRGAGLSDAMFDSPDTVISTNSYRRALNLAAQQTGLRHFSLILCQRQTFEKLGPVGYLVRHAPNLRSSLDRLTQYFRTHDTGSTISLSIDQGCAMWRHRLAGSNEESAVQQAEIAIGLACRLTRSALADTWAPDAVYFEHSAPADLAPFHAVFRCPVLFNQTQTGMEFPESDLDIPLRQSDAGLFAILDDYVARMGRNQSDDYTSQVRNVIEKNIEDGVTRIDDIAARLGMKRHTLQRRLKAENTSFQQLLDDVRFAIACRLLRETCASISEIAGVLDYAESAVFTRAFARRSGMTPRKWRQKNADIS